jgi:hypothetical protein
LVSWCFSARRPAGRQSFITLLPSGSRLTAAASSATSGEVDPTGTAAVRKMRMARGFSRMSEQTSLSSGAAAMGSGFGPKGSPSRARINAMVSASGKVISSGWLAAAPWQGRASSSGATSTQGKATSMAWRVPSTRCASTWCTLTLPLQSNS